MLSCVITGSNDRNLVTCTLDQLVKSDLACIIVATNVPCTPDISEHDKYHNMIFSDKQFSNGNEARNFAIEHIASGRVLFLESGSVPTEHSLNIHSDSKNSQVICGTYIRLYDFEDNFQKVHADREYYNVNDKRLHQSEQNEIPWSVWRDNNTSADVSKIRLAGNFDTYFCVDGVTENAEMGFYLHNLGLEFIVSKEAEINVYVKLEEAMTRPAELERIYIWFTDRCNYHCRMCRIGQKAYSPLRYSEPTLESIKELISAAKDAGVSKVELYGGEMMIRNDLFDVIEFCNQLGIETGFVTNGSMVTEKAAKRFAGLRVPDIPISLDGPYEELNDWVRGNHAWNRTMEGIKQLKQYKNTFSIFTVVLKQNFKYLKEMVQLAKDLGAESISFQPVSSRQGGNQYSDFVLDYTDIPILKAEFQSAFEMADKLHISIRSRSMVKTIPEYILRGEQLLLQRGCVLPLHDALITKTGKLQLCFSAYGSRELYKKSEWSDFMKTWVSQSYQTLQKLAVTGQCPGCLANCSDQKYLFKDS